VFTHRLDMLESRTPNPDLPPAYLARVEADDFRQLLFVEVAGPTNDSDCSCEAHLLYLSLTTHQMPAIITKHMKTTKTTNPIAVIIPKTFI
jgi:hypothetical protein